jgi:ParB family transcriptional regulator, chromosome partitioning protein
VFEGIRGRGGLGRGLDALIPQQASGQSVAQIPIDRIRPNPRQPRQSIDSAALQELADSIREHGLLQPLVVSRVAGEPDAYELVVGERRLRASRLAGLERVPAMVREVTPEQSLELALVENIQRADLSPLEEAAAYRQLVDEFGLTQEQVAARVGKARATVANTLRLLGLCEDARVALASERITEGHARALLALADPVEQARALDSVVRRQLTVRGAEDLTRTWGSRAANVEHRLRPEEDEATTVVEEALRNALGTKVRLIRQGTGGQLIIHFYSEEQLRGLYDLLVMQAG